jgi:hypothetical protein
MTKTCGEIVNAALDLSQLEGSNMLTYSRMIYLLNSAYGRLYDHITDQTEDWGSLQCEVSKRVEVPYDLLKVRGVYKLDGLNEGDELERVDHDPEPGQYWMRGEELICGGSPEDRFILRYYPSPPTITFPCKPEETEYEKIYDNHIAAVEDNAIRVVNLSNGEEIFHPFAGTLKDFVLVRGVPVWLDGANDLHGETGTIHNVAKLFQDKWGMFAYGYEMTDGARHAVSWSGDDAAWTGPWFHNLWEAKYRFENGAMLRAFYDDPDKWEDITETFVNVDRHRITDVVFSSPYMAIGIESKEGNEKAIMVVDDSNSKYMTRPMIRQGNTPPVTLIDFDHNDENGYGIIYSSRGRKEISGFAPDTALDYPKTIYFDWIEAELAKLFLIEARQDAGIVDALAEQYWKRVLEDSERQTNYAHKLKDRRGGLLRRRH